MATRRRSSNTVRVNVMVSLTGAERRAFETLCASELRTPGGMVTRIVLRHLAGGSATLGAVPAPRGERVPWSVQLRLTPAQRPDLDRKARADGRTPSNLVTAMVVAELATKTLDRWKARAPTKA